MGQRALVVGFHVVDSRIGQQRADQSRDKSRVEIGNIAIEVTNDLSRGGMQGFPEILPLAGVGAGFGGDFRGPENPGSGSGRDFPGGRRWNPNRLPGSHPPAALASTSSATDGRHDPADGFRLVERRNADGNPLAPLEFHQCPRIGELAVVKTLHGHDRKPLSRKTQGGNRRNRAPGTWYGPC